MWMSPSRDLQSGRVIEPESSIFATFHEHIAELLRRIFYVSAGSLFVGLCGFLFSRWLAILIYRIADIGGIFHHPSLTFSDRFLSAALVSLIGFHYLFLINIYQFVSPGLYARERKTYLIPFIWAALGPGLAFGLLAMYLLIIRRFGFAPLDQLTSIRPWLIRFYLLSVLSAFLFALPRRKRSLSIPAYGAASILIWALPGHVFDTLLVLLIAACVGVLLIDSMALFAWTDAEVRETVNKDW